MTDQNQNPNPNPISTPVTPASPMQPIAAVPMWKNLLEKVRSILSNIFNKIYSNKRIFWPVIIAFGIIFLVIILGLLFGKRGAGQGITKLLTPSPIVQNTPQASASGDILINSQNKLNDLKKQINNLDVRQSRLQPPTLNFDIKF